MHALSTADEVQCHNDSQLHGIRVTSGYSECLFTFLSATEPSFIGRQVNYRKSHPTCLSLLTSLKREAVRTFTIHSSEAGAGSDWGSIGGTEPGMLNKVSLGPVTGGLAGSCLAICIHSRQIACRRDCGRQDDDLTTA